MSTERTEHAQLLDLWPRLPQGMRTTTLALWIAVLREQQVNAWRAEGIDVPADAAAIEPPILADRPPAPLHDEVAEILVEMEHHAPTICTAPDGEAIDLVLVHADQLAEWIERLSRAIDAERAGLRP